MKHILLFGLLLASIVSCKNNTTTTPTATSEDAKSKEIKRLLEEANHLWSPPDDSSFTLNNSTTKHISINDKEIWAKLDSALAIDSTNIKAYLARTNYLISCKKLQEVLPILRTAEKKAPFNAELWSMKAVFEDYYGDSLVAQKNYRSADSAYAIYIEQYATDSIAYPAYRMSRALNMALMTDNFTPFEEELKFTQKVFPKSRGSIDKNFFGKNKKDFFNKFFNGQEYKSKGDIMPQE